MKKIVISLSALLVLGYAGQACAESETWGQMGSRYYQKAKSYMPGMPGITTATSLGAGFLGSDLIGGVLFPSKDTGVVAYLIFAEALLKQGLLFGLISQAITSLGAAYADWGKSWKEWLEGQVKLFGPTAFVTALPKLIDKLPDGPTKKSLQVAKHALIVAIPLMPGLSATAYHYTPYGRSWFPKN